MSLSRGERKLLREIVDECERSAADVLQNHADPATGSLDGEAGMSAIDKLREQIVIGRETGHYVVLTVDEAQAVLDEALHVGQRPYQPDPPKLSRVDFTGNQVSAPPHEEDDDHAH